jgi:hypothetical protein
LSESPGPIFAGPFEAGTGLDIVALNPGTGDVTLISGLSSGAPTSQVFSSGGFDPVAAFALLGSNGFEDLVIANNGDGRVALLEGTPDGLALEEVNNSLGGLSPTALALASIHDNDLDVYATTEGEETASLLVFSLSASSPVLGGSGLTLVTLQESSLPLIATLQNSSTELNAAEGGPGAAQGETAVLAALTGTTAGSFGQSLFGKTVEHEAEAEQDDEPAGDLNPTLPADRQRSPWKRIMIGLDKAFEEFRRPADTNPKSDDGPEAEQENQEPVPESPDDPSGNVSFLRATDRSRIIDAAIDSLAEASYDSPAPVMLAARNEVSNQVTEARFEPIPLTWLALAIPAGGFVLTRARPMQSMRRSCGFPTGRTKRGASSRAFPRWN